MAIQFLYVTDCLSVIHVLSMAVFYNKICENSCIVALPKGVKYFNHHDKAGALQLVFEWHFNQRGVR